MNPKTQRSNMTTDIKHTETPTETPAVGGQLSIFLISAMVSKKEAYGHRAFVGLFESKAQAVGTALEAFQTDGYSVTSYDAQPCEHLMSQLNEANTPTQSEKLREALGGLMKACQREASCEHGEWLQCLISEKPLHDAYQAAEKALSEG